MKTSAYILPKTQLALPRKFKQACVRRDDYLAKVFEVELAHLEKEVPTPNSERARAFIKSSLTEHEDRAPMSFNFPEELNRRINETLERKNIPRGAFFNRILFMLAASPATIDEIFFIGFEDWRTEVWSEGKHDGAFFQNVMYPLEQVVDPFWPIRFGLELKQSRFPNQRRNFFTTVLDGHLYGLNCYLEDASIPGTAEYQQKQREIAAFFGI
jgi:hypothetical protein